MENGLTHYFKIKDLRKTIIFFASLMQTHLEAKSDLN